MYKLYEVKHEKENYVINFNGASVNKTLDLSSIYNCSLTIDEMNEIEEFAIKHDVHSHAFINGDLYRVAQITDIITEELRMTRIVREIKVVNKVYC